MLKSGGNARKKTKPIYLDYAASADPNPGSIHELGVAAKRALAEARQDVAEVLRARPEEIIFTSGGTEGNNVAIQGAVWAALGTDLFARESRMPHIVTTNIEHPSVLETCRLLERRGLAELSIVPVGPGGIIDPKKIRDELRPSTILVSVMYANNEIGTIQPIREIAREIRHFRKVMNRTRNAISYPYFHTDAVQAVQYLDLDVEKLGVDMLTLSGSKIREGRKTGILYKKRSLHIERLFGGGDQEFELRPGTENVPEISRFAFALAKTRKGREKEARRLSTLRDYFFRRLRDIAGTSNYPLLINGDMKDRLPNNVNVTIPPIPSDLLVIELSAKGIMCSSKSACKSSRSEGSYVIAALRAAFAAQNSSNASKSKPGAHDSEIGGLRFSLGAETGKREIDRTILALGLILRKLETWYRSDKLTDSI